jgi:hypothetical protein
VKFGVLWPFRKIDADAAAVESAISSAGPMVAAFRSTQSAFHARPGSAEGSVSRSIIEAHEGAVFQFTCGELIGDCIVRFFEVSRAGWVKATQAKWPTLQRQ